VGGIGSGSGNHGANLGKQYWTAAKEREFHEWQAKQERQKEARRAALRERARVKARERSRARRAALKAAGIPLTRGGKEPSRASTPRMRRLRERRRIAAAEALAAQQAAALEARKVRKRARQAAYLIRKAAKKAAYIREQWWSPAIPDNEARSLLRAQHPDLDEMQLECAFQDLQRQARAADLNINRFVIADAHTDGVELARQRRAIFQGVYEASIGGSSLPDIVDVLKRSEAVADLKDLPNIAALSFNEGRVKNACQNAVHFAQTFRGNGADILEAVKRHG
jgi:hypothetical protein